APWPFPRARTTAITPPTARPTPPGRTSSASWSRQAPARGARAAARGAHGTACSSPSELLDQIKREIRRDGDTVYVRTVLPEMSGMVFGFARYAYLDVTVDVPKTATLKIDDSSGDMHVSDVQGAGITDSSGDQTLEHIAGDLDVADSSGEHHI